MFSGSVDSENSISLWTNLSEDESIEVRAFIDLIKNHPRSSCYLDKKSDENREGRTVFEEMIDSDPESILRILIAKNRHVQKCMDMFFAQVEWRAKWNPKCIGPKHIPNALPSGAWRLCGKTKEGYPISNYKLSRWKPDEFGIGLEDENCSNLFQAGVDEYIRYVAYMVELMIANVPPSLSQKQFVVIFDLEGFYPSIVLKNNVRAMIKSLIYVAQTQYPEFLRKVLMVNAPYGFNVAWKLIRPLLDHKTSSKIHFVSVQAISKDVNLTDLPAEYGGTHGEYTFTPDAL